jgi:hypothetical protein
MQAALARLEETGLADPERPIRGRLAVVLDLTGSRRESLRRARIATAAMFDAIKALGAIVVKLIYYRGGNECKAGPWQGDPAVVSQVMQRLSCVTGYTQIERALRYVEAEDEPVSGVVFIGDHCEDNPGELADLARTLGARHIPIFVFHEYTDSDSRSNEARPVFQRLAELSGGVYTEFNPASAVSLRELLTTVGAFSVAAQEGIKHVPSATTQEARQLRQRLLLLPAGSAVRKGGQ